MLSVGKCLNPCRTLFSINQFEFSGAQGDANETSIWKRLLPVNYSAQTPPKFDRSSNNSVYIALEVLDIDEVNENQMVSLIEEFI